MPLYAEMSEVSAPSAYKPGELLVRFEPGISGAASASVLAIHGATYQHNLAASDIALVQVPAGHELATAAALNAEPAVAYAEPNYRYVAFNTTPNDPYRYYQWGHERIDLSAAWDISTGSASVTVAVIDSGVDMGHPDLFGKLVPGYDFVENDAFPGDTNGHGTHVAGIIAAASNNGTGVAGVSWGARIMPVRVLDYYGSGWNSDITAGIVWAYTNGADIINLSLGGEYYSQSMQDAVNAAHASGTLVIAAMGNSNTDAKFYPAAYDNVLAVAATGPADQRSYYSNYGEYCDIAAPGGNMVNAYSEGIYSTMPTYDVYLTVYEGIYKNYDYLQGTSQAAPHIAGVAALLLSVDPTLTPSEVAMVVKSTATDLGTAGWDRYFGHGLVNADAALRAISPPYLAPQISPIVNDDGDGNYTLAWDAVSLAEAYVLEESVSRGMGSPTVLYTGAATEFTVTGQDAGIWYYRVYGINANGDGPKSASVSVGVVPDAPALIPITNPDQADAYPVSWSAVSGAEGYILQQSTDATFTTSMVRYVGPALTYDVTGQAGGIWNYRVRAYNSVGSGDWSGVYSTTVAAASLESPVLAPIDNADGDDSYLVVWSEVSDATHYTLEWSATPYFDSSTVAYTGITTTLAFTEQVGGTRYYRVRGFDDVGGGPWSNQEKVVVTVYVYQPLIIKGWATP